MPAKRISPSCKAKCTETFHGNKYANGRWNADSASFSCSFRGILHFFHAKTVSLFSKSHDYGTTI